MSALIIHNPATGEQIGEVALLDAAGVRALVVRARAAQPAWGARPIAERARLLLRFRDRLVERADEVADLSCAETGKLPVEALLVDVLATAGVAAWSAKRAEAVLGRRRIPTGFMVTKRAWVVREPYGVVGVIAPWNWPVLNAMRAVLPALVAGNTVVLKPSEAAPLSALLMRRLADEAGIPGDVFLVATGDGSTGAALVAAGVDRLSFTGGVETGRAIARAAAERLLAVSLELGGKDAMIVLRGADLDRAASAAVAGSFYNAGQICTSLERIYVEAAVHDAFVERVLRETRALRVGSGGDADVGSLTVAAQRATVDAQVRDAVARGARVLTGGRVVPGPGLYYEPTVLVDVTDEMAVMQEETFGPLLPIVKVADAADAIRRTNASRFGLGASIWGPAAHAESLVREVRAGMLAVNDALLGALIPGLPFGGIGESGNGRVHGDDGLREMSWSRGVVVDRAGLHEPAFYPLSRIGRAGALGAVRLLAGRGALRWRGLRALVARLGGLARR